MKMVFTRKRSGLSKATGSLSPIFLCEEPLALGGEGMFEDPNTITRYLLSWEKSLNSCYAHALFLQCIDFLPGFR